MRWYIMEMSLQRDNNIYIGVKFIMNENEDVITEKSNIEVEDEEDIEDLEDAEDSDDSDDLDNSIPDESKSEKFIRLAERRTDKVILAISKLGNLSNRLNYKYTEEEIEQIFDAIEEQSKTVKEKFYTQEKQEAKFKFK